jgi:hypothetical protein
MLLLVPPRHPQSGLLRVLHCRARQKCRVVRFKGLDTRSKPMHGDTRRNPGSGQGRRLAEKVGFNERYEEMECAPLPKDCLYPLRRVLGRIASGYLLVDRTTYPGDNNLWLVGVRELQIIDPDHEVRRTPCPPAQGLGHEGLGHARHRRVGHASDVLVRREIAVDVELTDSVVREPIAIS